MATEDKSKRNEKSRERARIYYWNNREVLRKKQFVRDHRNEDGGIIYFICEQREGRNSFWQDDDKHFVKIGYVRSTNMNKRLSTISTGNPRPLTLYAVVKCDDPNKYEWITKQELKQERVTKKEWYFLSKTKCDAFIKKLGRLIRLDEDPIRYVHFLFI